MPRAKVGLGANGLQEVWKADDDWTGVTTKEERKKRQNRLNRLNQRAYRRRHTEKENNSNKQAPFRVERFRILEVPRPDLTATESKNLPKPRSSGPCKRFNNPEAS